MIGFLVIGLIQFAIAIYGTQQTRRRFNWASVFVLLVVYGLAYDNLAVAIGGLLDEGDTLQAINAPRYWLHALFTPLMMISALRALRSMVDLRRAETDGINQSVSSLTVARSHHYHPSRGTTMWREMSALKWATTAWQNPRRQ